MKFKTDESNETILIEPEGLGDKVNEIAAQYKFARSFVRPSGTEDVLRVYAEAQTLEKAKEICEKVE